MPELISPLELIEEERVPESGNDLEAVRALVLRAHPDVIPELVTGDTVGSLLESVESARTAYARLAGAWSEAPPAPVAVPAGGGTVLAVDMEALPATEKIRRGLKAATRRGTKEN